MTFYGVEVGEDLNKVYGHLEEVRLLYDKAGHQYFFGDNMVALSRNMAFTRDSRFASAFNDNVRNRVDEFKLWRLHTYCWAGRAALALPGDFVECGVFEGFYSAVLLQYLDFATIDKRLFLYDTFTGLSEDYSTDQERSTVGYGLKEPNKWYDEVRERFAPYPNVEVIRGVVPDILREASPEAVAFLHLDMNAGAAEVGALRVLFEHVCDGGIILMNDYGRNEYADLQSALGTWLQTHGQMVLELPTGQGLVIKRS